VFPFAGIIYFVYSNGVAQKGSGRMIFETITTAVMGGIALKAYMSKSGSTNDSAKIQKIFTLSGLNVKDGSQTLTAQLMKRKAYPWGMEYRYRIPLGRSFEDYQAKFKTLEDGLNNRKVKVTLRDLRELKFDRKLIQSIRTLWSKKLTNRREIELSYDGMLILRIYNEPLPKVINWEAGKQWSILAGVTREKNRSLMIDFEETPHLVLGGATRYGKSNFINGLICSLLQSNPNHTRLHLIDLKGGVELCDYESAQQTVSIAYEPEEALYTLEQAYNEMRAIQSRLKRLGKKNVQEAGIPERHFIIIDEVGELNPDEEPDKELKKIKLECQTYMSKIARLGAGLGLRQILATQYPTGDVIPRACKQNSDVKICFRVQSGVASRVVLDRDGAESLPKIKGRAILQTADERVIVQTPYINSQVITDTVTPYIKKEEKKIAKQPPRTDTVEFEETGLS
jgi:DNA segregation ATPase FtsK/SpoIIIE, S-DNA-T family